MSKYLSRKIKFISLFSMIGVVFLHSYNFSDSFLTPCTRISEGFSAAVMFEFFFSNGICRFAVPMFFLISGFLFFKSYENSVVGYKKKVLKRCYSILTPYVLWSFISAVFILFLTYIELTKNLPIVLEHPVEKTTDFLATFINPPAFQLWYLQQILIFTAIAPLIYALVKYTKGYILILFGLYWLSDYSIIINSQALFFFSVGAAFSIFDKSKNVAKHTNKLQALIVTLIWILGCLGFTILAAAKLQGLIVTIIMSLICKLIEIIGVVAMWLIFDIMVKMITNKKALLLVSNHLFFIYALHEPLLHMSYQLALGTDSNSKLSHIILYICLPISTIAICVIVSMILRKIARPFHRLLTGGRS